jgi:GT2 family glycosyltransferase
LQVSEGEARHQRVCAIVPTYNRKELLARCLRSLLAQSYPLERIYVIDNGSRDGTAEYLRVQGLLPSPSLCYLRTHDNVGAAGAFHAGMKRALTDGCEWVWLIDDDSEAQPETLERLITSEHAADARTVAVCPTLVDEAGAPWISARGFFRPRRLPLVRWPYPALVPLQAAHYTRGPLTIDWALALGLLVRADAVSRVGLPRREFFFGSTDIEYTFRLSRHGSLWLIPSSRFIDTATRPRTLSRRQRQINRLLRLDRPPSPITGYWREVLWLRNYSWMMKHELGESLARFLLRLGARAVLTLLCDDRPFLRLCWLAAFAFQARTGCFHRLTPDLWQQIIGS